jgi:hypothetical protein
MRAVRKKIRFEVIVTDFHHVTVEIVGNPGDRRIAKELARTIQDRLQVTLREIRRHAKAGVDEYQGLILPDVPGGRS